MPQPVEQVVDGVVDFIDVILPGEPQALLLEHAQVHLLVESLLDVVGVEKLLEVLGNCLVELQLPVDNTVTNRVN